MNADLRKKLRVDRVRKMTTGKVSLASGEEANQPDWMKVRSLREIETIRETKKRDMISQLMGQEADNICPVINVVPGALTFLPPL